MGGGGRADGGVSGVGEGAGLAVAESGEGMGGAAEGLGFGGSVEGRGGKRLAVGFSWGVGNGRVSIVVEDRSICHALLRCRLIEMLERRETINCRLT